MKYYLAEIVGAGEGCDYSIGCNVVVKKYNAENEQQVINQVLDDYGFNYLSGDGYLRIDGINIYEIPENYTKVENLAQVYADKCKLYKQEQKAKEEKELLKKLQEKYKSE